MYTAEDTSTAFAEVFQEDRAIYLDSDRTLSGWLPRRALMLLDLTVESSWATRNGASASLHAAPKSTCRVWASAIREACPDLDGLYVPSTMTLQPTVVLFSPAGDSFPAAPGISRPLVHPDILPMAVAAANMFDWDVSVTP